MKRIELFFEKQAHEEYLAWSNNILHVCEDGIRDAGDDDFKLGFWSMRKALVEKSRYDIEQIYDEGMVQGLVGLNRLIRATELIRLELEKIEQGF